MYSENQIITTVSDQFPVIFRNQDPISREKFEPAFARLIEYIVRISSQSLQSETFKLQWSLVGSALLLLTIKLFGVEKIKFADTSVKIDYSVIVWYSVFVLALLLIFWLRSAVDIKRFSLSIEKDVESVAVPTRLVANGWNVRMLELYFWFELVDAIGHEYVNYRTTMSKYFDIAPPPSSISIQTIKVDLESLSAESAEFRDLIAKHQKFLAEAKGVLLRASDRLQQSLSTLVEKLRPELESPDPLDRPSAYTIDQQCEAYYDATLRPWIDARGHLSTIQVQHAISSIGQLPENQKLQRQLSLHERALLVRKSAFAVEIVLPSIFSLAVVVYALFGPR